MTAHEMANLLYHQLRLKVPHQKPLIELASKLEAQLKAEQGIALEHVGGAVLNAPPSPDPKKAPHGNYKGAPDTGLTRREDEILTHLITGKPNKVIAFHVGICETTVKVHLRNAYIKLGANNRTQAAMIYRQKKQLEPMA